MRISDDRYKQELQRLNLGMRLLRLQAKSATIRACTGLSEDRIRKLFKTYLETQSINPRRRKRGKSPYDPAMLLRTGRMHLQSSALANLLVALEVAGTYPTAPHYDLPQAERCCDAFEYYLQLFDDPLFTFEHARLLVQQLSPESCDSSVLKLLPCSQCHALSLQDVLAQPLRPCPFCGARVGAAERRLYVRKPRPLSLLQAVH